jgi:hypothetical protein
MKFKRTLQLRTTIKKMKEYTFPELSSDDIKEGKTRDYENSYFCVRDGNVLSIYFDKEKDCLIVTLFHSWDKFIELKQQEQKCM